MLPAGKLRQTIVIQNATETRTGTGDVSASWATYATVRASAEPLQGREYYQAGQMQTAVSHRFRIRYLAGMTSGTTAKMRVLYDGRYFDIQAVIDPNERHDEMHLMCVERSEGA